MGCITLVEFENGQTCSASLCLQLNVIVIIVKHQASNIKVEISESFFFPVTKPC